jgi:hypothetical protein
MQKNHRIVKIPFVIIIRGFPNLKNQMRPIINVVVIVIIIIIIEYFIVFIEPD